MNNNCNYIEWKLCFALSIRSQTMSNNSFNTKLIFKPSLKGFNGMLAIAYLINGKVLLSTQTYASQTYIHIDIYAAWVCSSLYRDCLSYYVSKIGY